MGADQQVPMGVHLQQVPVQGIEHQSPVPHSLSAGGGPTDTPSMCSPTPPKKPTHRVGKVGSYL